MSGSNGKGNGHAFKGPTQPDITAPCFILVYRQVQDGKGTFAPGRVRRFWQRALVTEVIESKRKVTINGVATEVIDSKFKVKISQGTANADLVLEIDRLHDTWKRWTVNDPDDPY